MIFDFMIDVLFSNFELHYSKKVIYLHPNLNLCCMQVSFFIHDKYYIT